MGLGLYSRPETVRTCLRPRSHALFCSEQVIADLQLALDVGYCAGHLRWLLNVAVPDRRSRREMWQWTQLETL